MKKKKNRKCKHLWALYKPVELIGNFGFQATFFCQKCLTFKHHRI